MNWFAGKTGLEFPCTIGGKNRLFFCVFCCARSGLTIGGSWCRGCRPPDCGKAKAGVANRVAARTTDHLDKLLTARLFMESHWAQILELYGMTRVQVDVPFPIFDAQRLGLVTILMIFANDPDSPVLIVLCLAMCKIYRLQKLSGFSGIRPLIVGS